MRVLTGSISQSFTIAVLGAFAFLAVEYMDYKMFGSSFIMQEATVFEAPVMLVLNGEEF